MFYMKKKGQSTLEYVILTGVIVGALIYAGVYVKRSLQGKIKESSDQIGEQYSTYHTASQYKTTSNLVQTETQSGGGASTINYTTNTQSKTGSETVEGLAVEDPNK